MAASFHAFYLLPQLNSDRSSRHNIFCRMERAKQKSVYEMAVERKENDLPKFTSNVILEWGLVNTKYSNLMMPDFLV